MRKLAIISCFITLAGASFVAREEHFMFKLIAVLMAFYGGIIYDILWNKEADDGEQK